MQLNQAFELEIQLVGNMDLWRQSGVRYAKDSQVESASSLLQSSSLMSPLNIEMLNMRITLSQN